MTKSTVKKNDVVAQLARLTQGARAAGVPVIFGPMAYTEEDYADQELQRRSGLNRLMFENKMFLAGSFGADFHADIQPQPGDVNVPKLVVAKLHWDQRPTAEGTRSKFGPAAAEVGALYRTHAPTSA